MILMISGCFHVKPTPFNIPYPPVRHHVFEEINGLICLPDDDNKNLFYLWKEEVKDYISDVEKFRQ